MGIPACLANVPRKGRPRHGTQQAARAFGTRTTPDTFTIITTGPNQLMQPIRYPMIMLEVIQFLFENR